MNQDAGDGAIQITGKGNRIRNVRQKKVEKHKTVVVVTPPDNPSDPAPQYEVRTIWRTPLTKWRVRAVSTVAFLGSLASLLGMSLRPNFISPVLIDRRGLAAIGPMDTRWLMVGMALMLAFVVCLGFGRILKYRKRTLSRFSFMPGLMEIDGRLAVVGFTGRCPGRHGFPCNAQLRFQALPTTSRVVRRQ